jgi:hypothetical protein
MNVIEEGMVLDALVRNCAGYCAFIVENVETRESSEVSS